MASFGECIQNVYNRIYIFYCVCIYMYIYIYIIEYIFYCIYNIYSIVVKSKYCQCILQRQLGLYYFFSFSYKIVLCRESFQTQIMDTWACIGIVGMTPRVILGHV